jgi:hypothetical protein
MKKSLYFISLILLIHVYYSCKRDMPLRNNDEQFSNVKPWFNSYIANGVNPLFLNAIYHWDKASIFTFKNGYKVFTVPITERKQNPAYNGRRILYLYPWKNGKGFYATIFELIPTLEHLQANKGNIDLHKFTGFISTWDLKKGFVRGSKFTNGLSEKNINIEVKNSFLISKIKSQSNSNTPITLPNVTVIGFLPGPNLGSYLLTLMNSSGYSTSYLWSGGDQNNPCEYSGCGFSENPYDYFDSNTINLISQKLLDQQWQIENVKDSTNNPCVTDVVNQLSILNENLPVLIRNFFSSNGNFSMTLKMADLGQGSGGITYSNISSSEFEVKINSYFNEATNLALATTIMHEAFHCQLMSWFREAIINNNQVLKEQLAAQYGYIFSQEIISIDSSLAPIVHGGNTTQHQDIVTRYKDLISEALFQFAQSKGIDVDLNYCKDLAWSGTFDSRAFQELPYNDQLRIVNRVNAEKDPSGNKEININEYKAKGHQCK